MKTYSESAIYPVELKDRVMNGLHFFGLDRLYVLEYGIVEDISIQLDGFLA
ncbi:MAG: hypothetical protein NZ922_06380 [Candidatus Methanomethyliaceae archaeon]|nr:hypothetical protein [Candidatus Methanomethyliaceae archaeon]MDW7971436.1 hypothetical protein [Nitrososphaerota archaeon]